ncbi:hypothetical protein GCM10009657_38030 [Oryzihumus leptocrescens]
MPDARVPREEIARLVGHRVSIATEADYREQLRQVVTEGAQEMDRILPPRTKDPATTSDPWSLSGSLGRLSSPNETAPDPRAAGQGLAVDGGRYWV